MRHFNLERAKLKVAKLQHWMEMQEDRIERLKIEGDTVTMKAAIGHLVQAKFDLQLAQLDVEEIEADIEARKPENVVAAIREQREMFRQMATEQPLPMMPLSAFLGDLDVTGGFETKNPFYEETQR